MSNEVKSNDGIVKTLIVVLVLCLVCSIVVAGSAVGLKSKQEQQKALDKQRNILSVAGLSQDKMDAGQVKSLFEQRIEVRLLDIDNAELLEKSSKTFDLASALKDNKQSIALSATDDKAGIKRRSNIAEIYLVRDDNKAIEKVVLPIYGTGLWSVMYAFIAIAPNGSTIDGISFYEHGETPGLGGEIENPTWRDKWLGKSLFDASGHSALRIVKGGAKQGDEHGIDGLSGATLTANGVQHTIDFWMGDKGFGPFLKKVRQGGVK